MASLIIPVIAASDTEVETVRRGSIIVPRIPVITQQHASMILLTSDASAKWGILGRHVTSISMIVLLIRVTRLVVLNVLMVSQNSNVNVEMDSLEVNVKQVSGKINFFIDLEGSLLIKDGSLVVKSALT